MGAINYSWIQSELQGLYGANVIREMEDIIGIYEWYDGTAQIWDVASGLDYRAYVETAYDVCTLCLKAAEVTLNGQRGSC